MRSGLLSLDAFLKRRAADRRLARLTHDLALPIGQGLEFGPANNPTPLPEGIEVTFIDHHVEAGDGLPDAVSIHHAWTGSGSLSAVLGREEYDFAIAAQVAQYVPNLLGWLRGIHSVLRPGGVLNLSLPDKRFMFDAARTVSTLAELVEADVLGYERPSPRQIFAHTAGIRAVSPAQIWAGEDPLQMPHMAGDEPLPHAYDQVVEAQATQAYVSCHCWVLTPATFLDLIEEATRLGLFPFVLNQIAQPNPGEFEFFVSMRRGSQEEAGALRMEQENATAHLRGALRRQGQIARVLAQR